MIRDFEMAYNYGGEQEYFGRQEYEHMMQEAPEDFWPNEEDFPDEPDFDSCGYAGDDDDDDGDGPENDGQPDEYTEWQDYFGGDDWDHGQYDDGGEG